MSQVYLAPAQEAPGRVGARARGRAPLGPAERASRINGAELGAGRPAAWHLAAMRAP